MEGSGAGIESLNRKAHYGGIAAGLAESGTLRKKSSQELPVPEQAMAELQDALQSGTPQSVLEDRSARIPLDQHLERLLQEGAPSNWQAFNSRWGAGNGRGSGIA